MEKVHQQRLFELDESKRVSYELLVGHKRTDGSMKTDEQLRSQYVHLTDELIRKMTEGVEIVNPETGERELRRPDCVVWLDKSARPVSWLTNELWDTLAPNPGEQDAPERPDFYFVNIDREQWINDFDPDGTGRLDIDHIKPSIIRSLRSIFVSPHHKAGGLHDPTIDNSPSLLDGKVVLLVDEVRSTGRTLSMSQKFFERAFPGAIVTSAHWMSGVATKNGAVGNADLPVWYKEKDVRGRGIGNRDERVSRQSKSLTQRLGSWFLSTALEQDERESSDQLRREIRQLAEDVRSHDVLVVPSLWRSDDDYDARAEQLNDMTFEEYKTAKQKLGQVL